ncbi:hypothetical protein ADL29_04465 [Streptomyces chattanoogensis]|uniref:Chaplin domain-containing protein n=2 Tax=Streptomyces chattanoogensis TaxID=66876 RepID=A0A0N0H3F5_9ACTN|nr:hypothetical protein ADL29_04465 [Streptomyces chattanoogensis]
MGHPGMHGDSMNTTTQHKRQKKSVSRILAVSAALGFALAAGTATAASAAAEPPTTPHYAKTAGYGGGGGGDDCSAVINIICL